MKKRLTGLMLALGIALSVPAYSSEDRVLPVDAQEEQMEEMPQYNWGLRVLGWMATVFAGNAAVGLVENYVPMPEGSFLGSTLRPSLDVFKPCAKWVVPIVSLVPFFVMPALKSAGVLLRNTAREARRQVKGAFQESLRAFNEELVRMQGQMTGLMEEALEGMCSTLDQNVAPMVKHIVRDAIIGAGRGATGDVYVKTKNMLGGFFGRLKAIPGIFRRTRAEDDQSDRDIVEEVDPRVQQEQVRHALRQTIVEINESQHEEGAQGFSDFEYLSVYIEDGDGEDGE
ncbi:hypothetical protein ACFLX2_00235 [Candidatus Dependentiae bacterium]